MGADFGLDFAPDSKMATTYIILKLNMCRTRIFLLWKISHGQIFLQPVNEEYRNYRKKYILFGFTSAPKMFL